MSKCNAEAYVWFLFLLSFCLRSVKLSGQETCVLLISYQNPVSASLKELPVRTGKAHSPLSRIRAESE